MLRNLFNSLFVLIVFCVPAMAGSPWHEGYFPNTVLVDQDGNELKFYDDAIKGKVVAVNFIYTNCKDVCPVDTAQLMRVNELLGERVGKDIFFYSISLDPERDTPAALKRYREMFGITAPGWKFLTGKAEDIKLLQEKLGLIGVGTNRLKEHDTSFIIGNEKTGHWIKRSPYDEPKVLAILLGESLQERSVGGNAARKSYAEAPQIKNRSAGDYIFRTRCAACHTVGGGDRLGPDLSGTVARRPHEWLVRWLKEPDKMIAEGDPVALEMKAAYRNLPMPNLGLNDADANALIDFLRQEDARLVTSAASSHGAH
jgi:protein SCO1/2